VHSRTANAKLDKIINKEPNMKGMPMKDDKKDAKAPKGKGKGCK
jgi:hypothetical protein